jgi:Tfp pilus assembly protein PilO
LISKQQTARNTLRDNIKAEESLVAQYKQFVAQSPNLIGGNPKGTGDRDGDNARIILDALPSKYDFPALASSLEKLASANGTPIVNLTGVDDEVNQQELASKANAPASVEMPFQMAVSGNFDSVQKMIDTFQRSIRPISINTMTVVGKDSQLMLTVNAKTYYQPDAGLRITTEVVK